MRASQEAHPGRFRRLVPASIALAASAVLLSGAPAARAADAIEIGMSVGLTGYLASFDTQLADGVKLAVKVIGEGGIDGRKINLHILDNASNATTGVSVTNQLFNQYNVGVMINGALSAQSVAIAPIVARSQIPVIASAQLPPDPTWIYLTGSAFAPNLETQLTFAKQKANAKKIAFLYSQTPYGQNGAKLLTTLAPKLGLEVVFSEAAEGSATDLTPQLAKIKDAKPDAVVDFLTGPVHIVEAKGAGTVGLQVPIVMAADDNAILTQAAAAYPQVYFVMTAIQSYPNVPEPEVKAADDVFFAEFKKSGADPNNVVGESWGWDAVQMLKKAVPAAGAVTGEKLRAALEKQDLAATTTHYRFTPADHTGQDGSKTPQIGHFNGGKVDIAFSWLK